MKYNFKIFTEQGFLSEFGNNVFKKNLDQELDALLNGAESEGELRIIESLVKKRVGDMVSDRVLNFKLKNNKSELLKPITDEEFEKIKVSDEDRKDSIEKYIETAVKVVDELFLSLINSNKRYK